MSPTSAKPEGSVHALGIVFLGFSLSSHQNQWEFSLVFSGWPFGSQEVYNAWHLLCVVSFMRRAQNISLHRVSQYPQGESKHYPHLINALPKAKIRTKGDWSFKVHSLLRFWWSWWGDEHTQHQAGLSSKTKVSFQIRNCGPAPFIQCFNQWLHPLLGQDPSEKIIRCTLN